MWLWVGGRCSHVLPAAYSDHSCFLSGPLHRPQPFYFPPTVKKRAFCLTLHTLCMVPWTKWPIMKNKVEFCFPVGLSPAARPISWFLMILWNVINNNNRYSQQCEYLITHSHHKLTEVTSSISLLCLSSKQGIVIWESKCGKRLHLHYGRYEQETSLNRLHLPLTRLFHLVNKNQQKLSSV